MRARRAVWCALGCAALGACGNARSAARTAAEVRGPAVVGAPASVVVCGAVEHPIRVDGTRWLLGGMRAEVRPTGVVFAEDTTRADLVGGVETANGWVFVALDGLTVVTDGFLGPFGSRDRVMLGVTMPRSTGRAVMLRDGHLWVSDGRSVTVSDVLGRRVKQASFSDGLFGVAVLSDGAAAFTLDGGARWSPADLGGDVALDVGIGREMTLRLLHGWARLRRDGTTEAAQPPEDSPTDDEVPAAVREAFAARCAGVHMARGAWAHAREGELTIREAGGAVRRLNLSQRTTLERWGDGAVLHDGQGWARVEPDGRMVLLVGPEGRGMAPPGGRVWWSDDGVHAAWVGGCGQAEGSSSRAEEDEPGSESRAPDPGVLCLLEDGVRQWRQVSLPAAGAGSSWELNGLHGAWALLGQTEPVGAARFVALNTASGAVTPVRSEDPAVHLYSLRWSSDGQLAGLGIRGASSDSRVVVRGVPARPLVALAAPAGVDVVDFADERRGLAVAWASTALLRTMDGGHTWERVPFEGDPDRTAEEGDSSDGDAESDARDDAALRRAVTCDAVGCVVGEHLRLAAWGLLPPRPVINLAADGDSVEPPAFDADLRPSTAWQQIDPMRCAYRGTPTRSPWDLPGAPRAARYVWREGVGMLSPAASPDLSTLTWRTVAGSGSATLPDPGHDMARPSRAAEDVSLLLGTDHRALVMLSGPEAPQLLWLGPQGPRRIDPAPLQGAPRELRAATDDWFATATDDGGVVVAVRAAAEPYPEVVAEIGPDGAVRARRAFMVPDDATTETALARFRGRWGFVMSDGEGTRFQPIAGGGQPPEEMPRWAGALSPCARPAGPDAVSLHTHPRRGISFEGINGLNGGRTVIELTDGGACIRSIAASLSEPLPGGRQDAGEASRSVTVQLNAVRGALEGFMDDGARRLGLRCAPGNAVPSRSAPARGRHARIPSG